RQRLGLGEAERLESGNVYIRVARTLQDIAPGRPERAERRKRKTRGIEVLANELGPRLVTVSSHRTGAGQVRAVAPAAREAPVRACRDRERLAALQQHDTVQLPAAQQRSLQPSGVSEHRK